MEMREYIRDVLYKVIYENGYASLILRHSPFHGRDAALISEVVYGTLRNITLLEKQWKPYVQKADHRTAVLFDMSVYQMFFMQGIPAYAVINEAVNMAEKHRKKFVNAVLRQVERAGFQNEGELFEVTSHPEWMIRMWNAHYGADIAEKIARSNQSRPKVYGRINTLKMTKEELETDPHFHFVSDIGFTYDGVIQETDYFKDGKVLIQNISSQEVAKYLDAQEGMKVLDLCAAPGTKTQQIAEMMHNKGYIVACDLYPQRTKLIEQLMEKTGITICRTKVNDAMKRDSFEKESFDRILMDVPCSGMGDLSHKPEIRWRLKPEDIDDILPVQRAILENGSEYLKPKGILVYSTCTLNQRENEKMVHGFLKEHPEFELISERTIFPFETDGDGFYMAKLKKGEINRH